MILSDRLEKILEFVSNDSAVIKKNKGEVCLADIGCDHGFIPIEAVTRGYVNQAIASDINEGPIKRAEEHIQSAGLSDRISTRIADGLLGLNEHTADILVITGMGGRLIARILEEGKNIAKSAEKMILSPQSDIDFFRGWLCENGYEIEKEACVLDEEKIYFIMDVKKSDKVKVYDKFELEFGREETFDDDSLVIRNKFIDRELSVNKSILSELSDNDSEAAKKRREEILEKIDLIEGRKKVKKSNKKFWLGFLVGVIFLAIAGGGAFLLISKNYDNSIKQKITEIKGLIDNYFIFDYEEDDLENGIYTGYMEGLDDVYSEYYTKEQIKELSIQMNGNYAGIGSTVSQNKETGEAIIIGVYENSPAEKAGLKINDIVVKVDGEDCTSWSLNAITEKIRGEKGTDVVVAVRRDGEIIDLTITRDNIEIPVITSKMLDNKIGYICFTQFIDASVDQMKSAISELEDQGAKGLIIDVRNNPGGTLEAVLQISSMYLDEGLKVTSRIDKAGNEKVHKAAGDKICDLSMVILVNEHSASAAELFTGAMRDNNRATIVGTTTFGKGIVQQFFTLSDGSGIKLTTEHYYTPSGECIHKVGITPDIEVALPEDATEDLQLNAAIEVLQEKLK